MDIFMSLKLQNENEVPLKFKEDILGFLDCAYTPQSKSIWVPVYASKLENKISLQFEHWSIIKLQQEF